MLSIVLSPWPGRQDNEDAGAQLSTLAQLVLISSKRNNAKYPPRAGLTRIQIENGFEVLGLLREDLSGVRTAGKYAPKALRYCRLQRFNFWEIKTFLEPRRHTFIVMTGCSFEKHVVFEIHIMNHVISRRAIEWVSVGKCSSQDGRALAMPPLGGLGWAFWKIGLLKRRDHNNRLFL